MNAYTLPTESIESELKQRNQRKSFGSYGLKFTDETNIIPLAALLDLLGNMPVETLTIDDHRYPVVAELTFYGKGYHGQGKYRIQEFYVDPKNFRSSKEDLEMTKRNVLSGREWDGKVENINQYSYESIRGDSFGRSEALRIFVDGRLIGYIHDGGDPQLLIQSPRPEFIPYAENFYQQSKNPTDFVLSGHSHNLSALLPSTQDMNNLILHVNLIDKPYYEENEAKKIGRILGNCVNMIIGTKIEELKKDLDSGKDLERETILQNWQRYFLPVAYTFSITPNGENVIQIPRFTEII